MTDEPTTASFVDVLRDDLRRRWREGDYVAVEDLVAPYPALRADAEAVQALVYEEFLLRRERGEAPEPDEYARRFPQFAPELARLFEVHHELSSDLPATGSPDPAATAPPATAAGDAYPEFLGERGRYRITARLAAGSFGVVYQGYDEELRREVAVKVPRPDRLSA